MANYKARLQLKHGKKADLPTDGRLAEPMYCTDTHELAIGNDKGEEYTFIGGVSKEQIEALERSINEAIELATKTASAIETDLIINGTKLGSVSINNLGISVKDNNNSVKFSVDSSLVTYAETLKAKNISLSNVTEASILPVTRGNTHKSLTYYVSPNPKGKADGSSRDNACSDFYTVADMVFKQYGHLCPATKIQIWIDPGVYTQDMSIPYLPGNIWEVYIQTDVNGTATFSRPVNIYHANSNVHFCANASGLIKFQSVDQGDSETEWDTTRRALAVYSTNLNVEFSYCHWVTPITSEYEKYCVFTTPGSRNINLSFSNCDFYGYDALLYKRESHGEILLYNCVGNLTYWVTTDKYIPNIMGLNIYLYDKCPVVTQEPHTEITLHKKTLSTPTNSSYYKTTTDPGGSGTVIQPPITTESVISKGEHYSIGSSGTKVYNWSATFEPHTDPSDNPTGAVPQGYGSTSLSSSLSQGSARVMDTTYNKTVYFTVDYGTWVIDDSTLAYLHELGAKERRGTITNLTAKLIFTHEAYYNPTARPRIIYPPAGVDIPNHMVTDSGYYVTQSGGEVDGYPTYVLELEGDHPLASTLKNDLFYSTPPRITYGDSTFYGIQIGSYKYEDCGRFSIELVISYKEKVTVIG